MFDQETPDPNRTEPVFTESSDSVTLADLSQVPDLQNAVSDLESDATESEGDVTESDVPETVGPFEIVETLGTGAMGEVYLARDQRLDRWVALKRIQPGRHGYESVTRFRREARAAAKLRHRSIVQIHDLLETEQGDWLVMERLEGEPLAERLKQGPLEPLEALYIAIRIAEGLAIAHDFGVMHRDLKASNIMLTPTGVKILDFGLAKSLPNSERQDTGVTSEGQLIGTIASMAPEQARGLAVDERADLFAFGMLIYQMLAGESPFKRRSALATLNAICDAPAERLDSKVPGLTTGLVQLVHEMLAKNPQQRPSGGAHEIAERLRRARVELGGSVSGDTLEKVSPRPRPWYQRPLVALAALAAGGLIVAAWSIMKPATPKAPLRLTVLPFEYEGPDGNGFFAQGLAEEIRSRLTVIDDVQVIRPLDKEQIAPGQDPARNPDQVAHGSPASIAGSLSSELASSILAAPRLRVDYSLSGHVRWPTDGSPVSVELALRRADGSKSWSRRFLGPSDDVLSLQADLANEVAISLPIELTDRQERAIRLKGTYSQAAYLAYLEGRDWERRTRYNRDFIRSALDAYRRAVEADKLFVDAHARLIRFETLEYLNHARSPERADEIYRRLLALERVSPDSVATRLALAEFEYRVNEDYPEAITHLEWVLELQPSHGEALATLGWVLRRQNKYGPAIEALEKAADLSPYDASLTADIADTLRGDRQFGAAFDYYSRSLEREPGNGWVRGQAAFCLFEMQDCDRGTCDPRASFELLDQAPDTDDEAIRLHRFLLEAQAAAPGDAEALSQALEHLPTTFEEPGHAWVALPTQIAVLKVLGRERALEQLIDRLRPNLERWVELDSEYPTSRSLLALVQAVDADDAEAGRAEAEEALVLAKRDLFSGPVSRERWAMALALTGSPETALAEIETLLGMRYQRSLTRQALRLDPVWASIREFQDDNG